MEHACNLTHPACPKLGSWPTTSFKVKYDGGGKPFADCLASVVERSGGACFFKGSV